MTTDELRVERDPQNDLLPNADPPSQEAGFSILEVYVAAALLVVVMFSAMLTVVPVSRQVRISDDIDTVVAQVQNTLERLQVTPYSDIVTAFPAGVQLALTDVESGTLTITYEDPTADPLQIRVTANWTIPDLGPVERIFSTTRTE